MNRSDTPLNLVGYPNTYIAVADQETRSERSQIFDPALKQYSRAFRWGDPLFADPEVAMRWKTAQRDVARQLLLWVNASPWKDHLVLRGSLLMKAWFGDAAREPGDIDWVVRPANITIDSPETAAFFTYLTETATANPHIGGVTIQPSRIATDDIWTYNRVPGRRIVFPWESEDTPSGAVQMDLVFGENLWQKPVLTPLYGVPIWSATKEVSLAWKLLWLETDAYPQTKDFYDATLLAEATSLHALLLHEVLQTEPDYKAYRKGEFPRYIAAGNEPTWDEFVKEYPHIQGTEDEWKQRLLNALAPTRKQWEALVTP